MGQGCRYWVQSIIDLMKGLLAKPEQAAGIATTIGLFRMRERFLSSSRFKHLLRVDTSSRIGSLLGGSLDLLRLFGRKEAA